MGNRQAGEISLRIEGAAYTLLFDWEAIAHFEDETDLSILEVMVSLQDAATGKGRAPKISTLGSLLSAAMRRHHPEMDRIACMKLVNDPGAMEALSEAFEFAMPQSDDPEPGEVGNAPARPAKGSRSTGKRGSAKRSKAGSRSANSGAQRRA